MSEPPEEVLMSEETIEETAKLVVVAWVEVELIAVKFWRVVEPFTRRLPKIAEEEKRLVELAVVEKRLVVVAEVPVALRKVKCWRVVEPTTSRSPEELMVEVAEPPMESKLPVKRLAKELVEVAEVVVERVMLLKM